MPGGVRFDAGMWPRAAAAALIEQHNAVDGRVEIPPHRRRTAASRPAMQHQHRHPLGIATLLDIDTVAVAHINDPLIERINRRVKIIDCALLA